MADTAEVREFNICRVNSDYISSNHSVNLVISEVARSCHSNKQKINCFLPRNAYTSLSYSAMILKDMMVRKKKILCIRTCLFLYISSTEERISQKRVSVVIIQYVPPVTGIHTFWGHNKQQP